MSSSSNSQPLHYRLNCYDENSTSLSTSISEKTSYLSFEDPMNIVKKKPSILKPASSFSKKKGRARTGRKLVFKKQLCEVIDVESYKEFNVDMSEYYDFMGVQCNKKNCNSCLLF